MQLLIEEILSKRHLLALLTLILGSVVIWGMFSTSMDASYKSILSEDDPYRAEVEQTKLDFPPSTSVLFAFETNTHVFTFDALQAMDDLTRRYMEVESAISVGSLINRRLNAEDAETFDRDYLLPELSTLSERDLEIIRHTALNDKDLIKSLLARKGDMALAVIKYKVTTDNQDTRLSVAQSVITLRDSLREDHPNVSIYVLGGALFELDSYNAQIKDSKYLFPLVIGISILLLWFCLKSLSFSLCLFVIAFATIGLTIGTFGWAQIPFNQISSLGPLVVFVIAIADGIHIVSIYAQGLNKGLAKMEAMRQSLIINIQPVTLATITTAMGFLCLNYSSSPGIYGFGNIVAIGVCWAYLVTLTLLPALILLLPTSSASKPLGVQTFILYVSQLVEKRGNLLFWCSALLIVTTLALLPLNKVDFNRYSFVDKDSDFHHVMKALAEKIGNDQSLVYSIHSGEYYGITELEFLTAVDEFSLWLEEQPEASFVTSYTDFLRSMNKSDHDDDEAWDKLPQDKLQIIDYLVGYQLVQEIEPSLEPIFNSDYSAIRLMIGTSNLSNLEIINFNDRIDAWIATHVDPKYKVMHGDNSILFARLDRSISIELMKGFSLSFILITLSLIVGLRSFRYGLLSIMPNLFPATIVFGFWGLFIGELSPYILMLFSISIGLVVDDSVHILSKYISAKREGKLPEEAVRYSLDKAGSAITITTLSLAVGTFVLIFSNTFHFQNVALLLTPIIVVALLLDLLFLPPLLIKFDRWMEPRAPTIESSMAPLR
ncbi:MAG: MMPL family transporter [Gammaproteobacteria bacterium]|nr:MMPL family transporter [Gammaproteobacteria bacterium]